MKNYLTKIILNNFRSHSSFVVEPHEGFNIITGKNGAGKTNILEAVSLLSAGRGFRGAVLSELQKFAHERTFENTIPWSIYAEGEGAEGEFTIGTGADIPRTATTGKSDKRIIKINGEAQRGQNTLHRYVSVQWLVPSQDQIFSSGFTSRRQFLDDLTVFLLPGHNENLAKFEHTKSERKKLLERNIFDDAWLKSIELKMAEYATAIAANRLEAIGLLQNAIAELDDGLFPRAMLGMRGTVEELMLQYGTALEVEEKYREVLKNSRSQDAEGGRTNFGPHRSDFLAFHSKKNLPAELCSTGEQKAMLLSITMASIIAKKHLSRVTPILLLDEVIAHLDELKRAEFFNVLSELNAQIWLTGTEPEYFKALEGKANFLHIPS